MQEAMEMTTKELEQKIDQQSEDKAKLQANHEEIVANQKKIFERIIAENEAKHAMEVGQKVQDERKRQRERAKLRRQQQMCRVM
jgi:hypothetical protein